MKRFIAGVLVGTLISGSIAYAATYVANVASFKILVNGKEFTSDPPALVVEGRTYLPLRAMGDALGVPVVWNEDLRQAEVGNSAPMAEKNQYSRTNPAPINTVQTYISANPSSYIDMSSIRPDHTVCIRILDVVRGEKANAKIKKANMFNGEPKEGYEYIIARVAFSAISIQNDVSINASYLDFNFYSENNVEYEDVYVDMEDKLNTNLYAGGNTEGYIVGQVRKDDANPKVAYGLLLGGEQYGKAIWFNLQ